MRPIKDGGEAILRQIEARRRVSQGATVRAAEHGTQSEAEEAAEAVPDADVVVLDPPQPVHGTRGDAPGPRGCWAISTRTGQPCGAAARGGEPYCNAHAGVGVASDPARYRPLAHESRRQNLRVRGEMRLLLGSTRTASPRTHLKARAFADAERLAAVAVNGALGDPRLALRLIDSVDPPVEARLSVDLPTSVEEVNRLSMSQLLALAEREGIELSDPSLPELESA